VADGILDQRLQDERGDQRVERGGVGRDADRQALLKPDLLDRQVALGQRQLFSEGNLGGTLGSE
jgi:hypothetical protein